MDKLDRKILQVLQANARASLHEIGQAVGLSHSPCWNRIKKMEDSGVIEGYTVRLKPQVEAHRIRALMSIAVEGNGGKEVLKALRGHPNVSAIYTTNGRWDIVAELQAESLEAFDQVLSAIRLFKGIANTETSILLSTHKL